MLCIYFYKMSNTFCELNAYNHINMVRWTWILLKKIADLRDGTPNAPPIPHYADAGRCWAAPNNQGEGHEEKPVHHLLWAAPLRPHVKQLGHTWKEWKVAGILKVQRFLFWKWETVRTRATKILTQALSDLFAGFWSFDSFDVLLGVPHILPDPGTCNFSVLFCWEQTRQLPRNCGVSFLLDTGNAGSAWKKVVSPPSKASLV